jgi:hypothetical protein
VRLLRSLRQSFCELADSRDMSLSDMVRRLADQEAARVFYPVSMVSKTINTLPKCSSVGDDDCYMLIRISAAEKRSLHRLAKHYNCTLSQLAIALCVADLIRKDKNA